MVLVMLGTLVGTVHIAPNLGGSDLVGVFLSGRT